ncbi:hypothetical protein IM538_08245 [Cytobacillus suaedae]|nr:hypothetical protein IM538_08245 [Cytobacillus suaedae]
MKNNKNTNKENLPPYATNPTPRLDLPNKEEGIKNLYLNENIEKEQI